jgi:hypothetical protein
MARRLIVERFKAAYYRAKLLTLKDIWWDREVVPLAWINQQLMNEGHRWKAKIVDNEYEFEDLASP